MLGTIKQQKHISTFWGVAKITYTHTAVYFNLGTFLLTTAVFWFTTGSKWSIKYLGFSITYPGFLACLICGAICAGIIIYKFEMPSSFRFWFDQGYKHSTLLPADIEEIKQILRRIEKRRTNREKGKMHIDWITITKS